MCSQSVRSQASGGLELLRLGHDDANCLHHVGHGDAVGAWGDSVGGDVEAASVLVIVHDPAASCGLTSLSNLSERNVLVAVEDTIVVDISVLELLVENSHLGVLVLLIGLEFGQTFEGYLFLGISGGVLPLVEALNGEGVHHVHNFGVHACFLLGVFLFACD